MARIVEQNFELSRKRWAMTNLTAPMNPGVFRDDRRGQLDAVASANQAATNAREAEMRAHMAGAKLRVKTGAGVAFAGSLPSGTPTGA